MNRKINYDNTNELPQSIISELQNSLLTIKKSHQTNERIFNQLYQAVENEQQTAISHNVQQDIMSINKQLGTLLDDLKNLKTDN